MIGVGEWAPAPANAGIFRLPRDRRKRRDYFRVESSFFRNCELCRSIFRRATRDLYEVPHDSSPRMRRGATSRRWRFACFRAISLLQLRNIGSSRVFAMRLHERARIFPSAQIVLSRGVLSRVAPRSRAGCFSRGFASRRLGRRAAKTIGGLRCDAGLGLAPVGAARQGEIYLNH